MNSLIQPAPQKDAKFSLCFCSEIKINMKAAFKNWEFLFFDKAFKFVPLLLV